MKPDSTRILALLNTGNIELAERQARELVADEPDNGNAQYVLGLVHLLKGDPTASIPWLEKAAASAPGNAVYHANLGVACLRASRHAAAIEHLEAVVQGNPDYHESRYNLGCAFLEDDQAGRALECFRTLSAQQPDNAGYLCALGDAARALNDWDRAVRCYRSAIKADAGHGRSYINLAPILMFAGFVEEAQDLAHKAIELEPKQISGYKTLGDCLVRQESFDGAMDAYADAYDIDPDSALLCAAIGELWLETGEHGEAAAWCQKAVRLDENSINAHCGLARICSENGNVETALEMLAPVLERAPDNPDLHVTLGDTLWDDGDAVAALRHYREAQALQPERISLHARVGRVLSSSGDIELAVDEHRHALEKNPACIASLSGLAVTLRGKLDCSYKDTMMRMLGNEKHKAGARASLHNGLAFYHDGVKDYETAARHTVLANSNQWQSRTLRGWHYDPDDYSSYVSALISTFGRDYFERIDEQGKDEPTPVFIVGMPRSGTTLTEQILARHARVLGIGERNFARQSFHAFVQPEGEIDTKSLVCFLKPDPGKIADLHKNYLARLVDLQQKAGKPGVSHVVDKLPDNYSLLGWILTLFPGARIIHCRRDPRAVALSCWMTQFGSIRWACKESHLVERIRQYRRLMDHWRAVIPGRFLELDYESLVANQESESRRLIEWIGLEWDNNCLSFYKSDRLIRTASITQVREPIYTRSVNKWKDYEDWLPALFGPLTSMINQSEDISA